MASKSAFGDLLQRADRLLDKLDGNQGEFRAPTQIDKNISQVFEQGERLWKKAAPPAGNIQPVAAPLDSTANTSLLWGPEILPSLRISDKLQAAVDAAAAKSPSTDALGQLAKFRFADNDDPAGSEADGDLELFLRNERETMLINLIEETIKHTSQRVEEKAFEAMKSEFDKKKRKLISAIPSVNFDDFTNTSFVYKSTPGVPTKTVMTDVEIRFSRTVSNYVDQVLQGGSRTKLVDALCSAVTSFKNDKFSDLWQQVKIMLDTPTVIGKNVFEQRKSNKFKVASTCQALTYLENQFLRHMQMIVHGSLEKARLGGVPGVDSLVKGYLNVKFPAHYVGYEDGLFEGHPVWGFIFYCLRAGDAKSALNACEKCTSSLLVEFATFLREIVKTNSHRLSREAETKIALLWRTSGRMSHDAFKKASFCIIVLCDTSLDHVELAAEKFEDWLWIRLRQVFLTESAAGSDSASEFPEATGARVGKADQSSSKLPLDVLRKQILEDYGERHFANGDSPLLYWTALWLTGQLEAAIDFAYRQSEVLRSHAVHIALAAYESHLLLTTDDFNAKICAPQAADPPSVRRLNFARLIFVYVSQFQATNPRESLDYFYFLRSFKSAEKENLFFASVRDLLSETKELGLVDKYNINSEELIEFLAIDSEKKGFIETAVALYDLAGNHTKVLQLLNEYLCQLASQPPTPGSNRERLLNMATTLAIRYRNSGHKADPSVAASFLLLLDIVKFFDMFHEHCFPDALEVMRQIKLIPMAPEEVDFYVKNFFEVDDEVRRTLPDVLVSVMTILSAEFKRIQGDWSFVESSSVFDVTNNMKGNAKALVMYAGLIPYRIPAETAARLVQMETLMH